MKINQSVYDLVAYGVRTGLVKKADRIYTTNRVLEILGSFSRETYDNIGSQRNIRNSFFDFICQFQIRFFGISSVHFF